jgi:hypothetical protein
MFTEHDCFGECFHIYNGYCDGKTYGPTSEYFPLYDMNNPRVIYMRPVIAAVARCAWLDESKERFRAFVYAEKHESWTEADMNAEAWQIWGELK